MNSLHQKCSLKRNHNNFFVCVLFLFYLSCFFCSSLSWGDEPGELPQRPIKKTNPLTRKEYSLTKIDLGFGFPNLLSLDLSRKITLHSWMGMGVGFVPAYLFVPQLRKDLHKDINEVYEIQVNPHAHAFTWRSFFRNYLSGDRTFASLNFDVLFINAGGTAELTNKDTGNAANLAQLDVTLIQPIISLSMGHSFWKTDSSSFDGGLGISFLLPNTINSKVSGSLPAYLDVVPESREAIYDGMDEAKSELTDLLDQVFNRYRVLPSLYIQVSW